MKLDHNMQKLEHALLKAHQEGNSEELVLLYQEAGNIALKAQNIDSGCFYLTIAYIHALDCDHEKTSRLHQILCAYGREI